MGSVKHNTLENSDSIHKYYRVSKVIPGIRDLTRIKREIAGNLKGIRDLTASGLGKRESLGTDTGLGKKTIFGISL